MPAYAYVNRLDDTVKKSNVMGEVFCKVFEFNALALAYFLKPGEQRNVFSGCFSMLPQ
jgi:hypothetical protein